MSTNAPLAGIRVLDFSRVLSGPHATRMLADLGAEVIKVEPPAGDLTRFSAPRRNGLASYFVQQNVGKANLSIDLATDAGAEIIRELVEHVDVVVENYRPGVMDRLGLGAPTLLALNPRLIVASISGYGQDGPWVKRRAYAPVVEAESGIIASQGAVRGGALSKDPHSHADVYTGIEASAAIVAALFQREQTGRGQTIDVSMAETMLYVNEHLHDALWDDEVDPQWIRSFQPGDYVVMTVANGESLIVSGHPAERGTFDLFLAAMGRSDLANDPRFADVASRLQHYDELRAILVEFAATISDPDEFERIFAAHGLAVGRVREPGELARTEWAEARHATVDIDDRTGGTITVPNVPWHFSDGADVGVGGVAKYRGEDNRTILSDLLGYDDERIDALESDRVISSRMPR
ncbi:CaiB/BaiF CoA transferase family protein [Ilumatobacter nonamiensis]|uniref:CaiB/BaiF CoA transferase family protein n=1 Tax=Ilumatobacter nonamiensis TaxID=467093 RepID=UPI00034B92AB|nr:CoA transferase [Ilumatobacter nonamiensis]